MLRRFCFFISIKHIGCNMVIQCHCSGNFASRDMMLISLKSLHYEQYDGEVNSKLSFLRYAVIQSNKRYVLTHCLGYTLVVCWHMLIYWFIACMIPSYFMYTDALYDLRMRCWIRVFFLLNLGIMLSVLLCGSFFGLFIITFSIKVTTY